MTDLDPFQTGTFIHVLAPTTHRGHYLVTDTPLTLVPDTDTGAARTHEDPATGIQTHVLVIFLDDGYRTGWLAANPDRCPLCTGGGAITVREGTLPRNDKSETTLPPEILDAYLRGENPEPVHDEPINVQKPCPLCRSIDYAMQMNDELGCI
jgi:hypothetical protein